MSEVEPPGEVEEVWPGTMGPYPLSDDRHYFYIESTSPFVHSGGDPRDVPAILLIQAKVGAEETGVYDGQTVSAVVAWREIHGAQEDGGTYVDRPLWERMDSSDYEPGNDEPEG